MIINWDTAIKELDLTVKSIKEKYTELKELESKSMDIAKELKLLTKDFESKSWRVNTKVTIGYLDGLRKQLEKFAEKQDILIEECTNHLLESVRFIEGFKK